MPKEIVAISLHSISEEKWYEILCRTESFHCFVLLLLHDCVVVNSMKIKMKMKNGLLRIAAQCWIVHETLKH